MVRVGGGWVALDEFLLKNDPCRGKCFIHLFYLIFFLSTPLPFYIYIYNIYMYIYMIFLSESMSSKLVQF